MTEKWVQIYLVTHLVKFYPQDERPTMVARRATSETRHEVSRLSGLVVRPQ